MNLNFPMRSRPILQKSDGLDSFYINSKFELIHRIRIRPDEVGTRNSKVCFANWGLWISSRSIDKGTKLSEMQSGFRRSKSNKNKNETLYTERVLGDSDSSKSIVPLEPSSSNSVFVRKYGNTLHRYLMKNRTCDMNAELVWWCIIAIWTDASAIEGLHIVFEKMELSVFVFYGINQNSISIDMDCILIKEFEVV